MWSQSCDLRTTPTASGLTRELLAPIDVVIDFTTPDCVLANIRACMAAKKNMVVGTTGWYAEIPKIRAEVEKHGTGFVYGSNFSIGVNLFFDLVQTSAPALQHKYLPHIYERHHAQKKDAPSGTAVTIQACCRRTPIWKLKSHPSAKAKWSACTKWCLIRPTTRSICAMTPNRGAGLLKAQCALPSGLQAKKVFSISRMFGGKCSRLVFHPSPIRAILFSCSFADAVPPS